MAVDLRQEFVELKAELKQTREIVRRYNDLHNRIITLESQLESQKSMAELLIRYGGWLVGVLGLLLAIYSYWGG